MLYFIFLSLTLFIMSGTSGCISKSKNSSSDSKKEQQKTVRSSKSVSSPDEAEDEDQSSTPLLHVIGVYEGAVPTNVPNEKEVIVTISDNKQPIILCLMAYDSTLWTLNIKSGVRIQKIILAGYHSQRIRGLITPKILQVYSHDYSPCNNCWDGKKYFYSYTKPPFEITEITGYDVTTFQGKYSGKEFFIFPGMTEWKN